MKIDPGDEGLDGGDDSWMYEYGRSIAETGQESSGRPFGTSESFPSIKENDIFLNH